MEKHFSKTIDRYLKHSDHNIRGIQLSDEFRALTIGSADARGQTLVDIIFVGRKIGLLRNDLRRVSIVYRRTLRRYGFGTAEHRRVITGLIVRERGGFGGHRQAGHVRQMQGTSAG